MNAEQLQLFALFAAVFVLLFWGRWRYDLVAFSALLVALVLGLVPTEQAFSGFGHPATVIVALVLVVSRGLLNSGAIDLITRNLVDAGRKTASHILIMSGLGAVLSAFMNNVAAMALLIPVDLEAARKAGRPVRQTLMPLSFATILGGMITLIGTPPNIIIGSFREQALGAPFGMFAFTPVGATVAIVGIAFVALVGWRLIPAVKDDDAPAGTICTPLDEFLAELVVPESSSKAVGQEVRDLYPDGDEDDVAIIGVVRNGRRLGGFATVIQLRAKDMLIVEAAAEDIDRFRGSGWAWNILGERPSGEKAAAGDLIPDGSGGAARFATCRTLGHIHAPVRAPRRHAAGHFPPGQDGFRQAGSPREDPGRRHPATAGQRPTGCRTWSTGSAPCPSPNAA